MLYDTRAHSLAVLLPPSHGTKKSDQPVFVSLLHGSPPASGDIPIPSATPFQSPFSFFSFFSLFTSFSFSLYFFLFIFSFPFSSPCPSLLRLLLLLFLIQRVWMGQAVNQFEAMGQRKIGGDNKGGLWVGRLPHPGHPCSYSCGKILLTILFSLFGWRAQCIVGNHDGGKSQRNVLCSLSNRLARSGATVVPLGLRC